MANQNQVSELKAKIAELEASLAAAKKRKTPKVSAKVSDKGGISVYGLGRFPVTLYRSQWERLMNEGVAAVKQVIEEHADQLATKE